MWEKISKEVHAKRFAGPYSREQLPFKSYVQSPLGLVPKAGINKTRLIFHLSYDFGPEEKDKSINFHTPQELCSVKYPDLNYAVRCCLQLMNMATDIAQPIYYSNSDFSHAFRILPILVGQRKWLVMKAAHPVTKIWYYFIDLCLPFGSSRSCALFQKFSNAIRHIVQHRLSLTFIFPMFISNYLDDFLFMALQVKICNGMIDEFIIVCVLIGCPVSSEKTERADVHMVFLGVLLDGVNKVLVIPMEKRTKALHLLNFAIDKWKVTIKFVQQLTGILNFLICAVIPGWAFTRGMYERLKLTDSKGNKLKQYHHVTLPKQFVKDCIMWKVFLNSGCVNLCQPFVDLDMVDRRSRLLGLYADASCSEKLGMGAIFMETNSWMYQKWDSQFIPENKPSIEFLELYALVVALHMWGKNDILKNTCITVHCDNQAVVCMVNNGASSCMQCLKLIRILVLQMIRSNSRIFVQYISTQKNFLADALSRIDLVRFHRLAPPTIKWEPDQSTLIPPQELWVKQSGYLM